MNGLDSIPALKGYIATTDKATATVILRGPEDDPILAAWQYGLGRSVAFTSDASSRWAANWIDWDGYADFWNQAVRWTISEGSANNIELRVTERGEQAVLVADVRDNRGNYLNGLNLEAAVVNTDLEHDALTLAADRARTLRSRLHAGRRRRVLSSRWRAARRKAPMYRRSSPSIQTTGWVLSYSAEYRVNPFETGQDDPANLLARIARITVGQSLANDAGTCFYA